MPGLVPGIHVFANPASSQNVDGRDKPGHDKYCCSGLGLGSGWGDVRAPLVGVIVVAGIVMRGVA
jgi:hypothetical protein